MSATIETNPNHAVDAITSGMDVRDVLACEWRRVELLCHMVLKARRGQALSDEELEQLQILQQQVMQVRTQSDAWHLLGLQDCSDTEKDVLACVLAAELEPRVGWLYVELQVGLTSHYPCPALLQELLALPPIQTVGVYQALTPESPLQYGGLLQPHNGDSYQPIKPEIGVTAQLRGQSLTMAPPIGATAIHTDCDWDDLVLPPEKKQALKEFLLWIQHRHTVVDEWQGQPGGGPVALFSGPSGTGKTFAASVIANNLGWQLYRVDLGRLVSKYIGETEKNLNQLFDSVQGRPVVLQFDEADSLFGKRGEIKEARDRYANMEVSHLLARIESHQGPVILTSNLRKHIDPAFARRFQLVLDFPKPTVAARQQLWEKLLPPKAPRADDVDTALLAKNLNFSGGHIRNMALHAAYLAAGDNQPIHLSHIALAAWRELAKDGRDYSPADLGALGAHLSAEVIA